MNRTFVFAYGSNLDSSRMKGRVPSASVLSRAVLPLYTLRFHKRSNVDGHGRANAFQTGDARDRLHGVVYEISAAHLPALDAAEGLGKGYDRIAHTFMVTRQDAPTEVEAWLYTAQSTHIDDDLKPPRWYVHHVLHGAREHGLPASLIDFLERIEAL